MGLKIDLIGQIYGRLTVLDREKQPSRYGLKRWICQCECGSEVRATTSNLKRNRHLSCGCLKSEKSRAAILARAKHDLTGRIFGRLTVEKLSPARKHGNRLWECACACGQRCLKPAWNLVSGSTRSCGCLPKRVPEDLTGKRFGRLLVLKNVRLKNHPKVLWECRCNCGQKYICGTANLKSGKTQSCGCLRSELTSIRRKMEWAKNPALNAENLRITRAKKARNQTAIHTAAGEYYG